MQEKKIPTSTLKKLQKYWEEHTYDRNSIKMKLVHLLSKYEQEDVDKKKVLD